MLFAGKFPIGTRVLFFVIAVVLAGGVHYFGLDMGISEVARAMDPFGAFFVGMFYTLGITTPTALVILTEMMLANEPVHIALAASLAAAATDTVLFMLMRKELERSVGKMIEKLHARFGGHNVLFSLVGLLMFGSPFPDEFALAFMQMSQLKPGRIFIVVFIAKLITLVSIYAAVRQLL